MLCRQSPSEALSVCPSAGASNESAALGRTIRPETLDAAALSSSSPNLGRRLGAACEVRPSRCVVLESTDERGSAMLARRLVERCHLPTTITQTARQLRGHRGIIVYIQRVMEDSSHADHKAEQNAGDPEVVESTPGERRIYDPDEHRTDSHDEDAPVHCPKRPGRPGSAY